MKKVFLTLLAFISISIYGRDLKVGTFISPPFVLNPTEGVCIELWNNIEKELDIYSELTVYDDIGTMLMAVENGEIDAVIGSLTINEKRARKFNFTYPYFITDLSIISQTKEQGWYYILMNIFSYQFFKYFILLICIIGLLGMLMWAVERKENDHFSKEVDGMFDGFYFVSVVMTTVGFGDKTPKTVAGKLITIVWMFISIGITGIFIANMSSSLTVNRLDNNITGISDLNKMKTGSVFNTTSGNFLENNGIKYVGYNNTGEALDAMASGELEAYVYDTPSIMYWMKQGGYDEEFSIFEETFDTQYYGFIIQDDKLLEQINPIILRIIKSKEWERILYKYK